MTSLYKTIMRRQSNIRCRLSYGKRTLPSLFYICASQLATASLLTIAIPSGPATAINDFLLCAAQLVRYAKVAPEAASVPCSQALNPTDLSRCVVTINQVTPALTQEALVACTKVRRPVELSSCVSGISDRTKSSEVLRVLDYCRRSLLPIRFSDCVTGLRREIDISIPTALDTCIAAEDYPRQLTPTFGPPPPQNPTLPLAPNLTPLPAANPTGVGQPINPVTP